MFARLIVMALVLLGLVATAPSAHALDIRTAEEAITLPAGTTVDDDLALAGKAVRLDGQVNGDAYVLGQTVTVTGNVERDLIGAAQQLTVDGVVRGDLRVAAQQVTINGRVDGNLTGFAQVVTLGSQGSVGGSVLGAAQSYNLQAPVGRGVAVAAETLQLGSTVGRDVLAHVETLDLAPGARIGGKLDYTSERQISVPPDVAAGGVQFHQADQSERRPERAPENPLGGLFGFFSILWLIGSLIAGVLLVQFLPGFAAGAAAQVRDHPLPTFGVGVLALFAVPVAIFFVAITFVGLPLAFLAGLAYLAGLYVGGLLVGLAVGELLVGLARRQRPAIAAVDPRWLVVLGLVVLYVVSQVPFIGGLVGFVVLCLGVGALLRQIAAQRQPPSPVALAPAAPLPPPAPLAPPA
jgi:cytoskeletal protein CcmA (bactofilin family)